jgi:hypothetical protein
MNGNNARNDENVGETRKTENPRQILPTSRASEFYVRASTKVFDKTSRLAPDTIDPSFIDLQDTLSSNTILKY